jgi:hypothetical protein
MRGIAPLIAVSFVLVLACAAALAMRSPDTDHAGTMDSCLAEHGWPLGLEALQMVERRVGHPDGLVQICKVEISTVTGAERAPHIRSLHKGEAHGS